MAAIPSALLTRSLGIGRIVAGVGPLVAPAVAAKQIGMGQTATVPEAQVMSQMFGARDLVLGALLLWAKDPAVRRTVIRSGIVIDSLDLASGLRAGDGLTTTAKAAVLGGAAMGLASGILLEIASHTQR